MIVSKVYNWLQNRLEIEIHCLLCRGKTLWSKPLCQFCLNVLPINHFACHQCALPLTDTDASICARCIQSSPVFDQCLSAYLYDYPVRQVIQAIKYQGKLELIRPITRQLTDTILDFYIDSPWPEAIIPIPLHKQRLRQRGFDQTLQFAKELLHQLSGNTDCKLDIELLQRTKATPPQQGLDAKGRIKNIRKAFALSHPTTYQHVVLIDDVVTTGATVSEAARLLKKAGVTTVDIWTLARTPEVD